MSPRLMLAAPASGSGKTTLTVGLVGAFRRRGLAVQPFKCGPDYIDPGYHTQAADRPCRNLDTWLLDQEQVRTLFAYTSADADITLIEGVMGLFDGLGALDDRGSSADVARLLDTPVVLIVDASGMASSVAALVDGFRNFDSQVRIGGVLLNRMGSARHADLCATAIQHHTGIPCFGYLLRHAAIQLPERHLGLVTTAEEGPWIDTLGQIADLIADTCDLDGLLALAATAPPLPSPTITTPSITPSAHRSVIAVAQDAAFSFTYHETRELLESAGAEVVPFSPIADAVLPPETRGIMLSGGFPELYAEALSRNTAIHDAIRSAHRKGTPIYAECGGLMYLTEQLIDQQDQTWPMVGLLPGRSVMTDRLALGYRTIRAPQDGPLLTANETMRGHEFHYSRWEGQPATLPAAYTVLAPDGTQSYGEGAYLNNLIASYIHLHWLANPKMAQRFVSTCAKAT
ncbi:MAG: cobyrinate a,c-diamide synthase [Chloroflexi bacterium AL-W]|nr:cobyrinate a,c-diamide synthase [Blastochloris sp.]NOK64264.1 cobyrinate a,c-diamide synthase [Chloroflexi bacterium AL-N1]NOK71509.1 cobyrinate a,c-diamide synthase [Chloroflexi bacterium AL-N10]NOK78855.1 cobyrinate a,c-diamide synthase [Chloroflexi bacterium AL-N5]NOK86331.1 cobyrinate a,c-diamide synthase [Chloroflexi bacterium AL-W]NOK93300.1 cobyrinate a,c-diamide synthase [Chloroflexi bacterium AL-N15]